MIEVLEEKLDTNIAPSLKSELVLISGNGERNIVLDLNSCRYCDSSGLSAILVANRILNSNGGSMRIAAPSEKVYSLIKITQLDRVLPVCETVDEAFGELKKE